MKGGVLMRPRSVAPMRAAKIGYIIMSAALCALGILLIGIICGVLMILFGVVRLTGYFSRDLYRLAFQYDLTCGIVLIALGVIMLANPGSLMTFICISLGLYILVDGMFKIQISLDAKSFGVPSWWVILIFAVITGVCGLALMLRPGEGGSLLMVILGITLVFEGILNFCTVITAVKIIKNQKPDYIEADFIERED